MNILQDRFSTGQVVQATGVSNAVLQSWLKRGLIVGHRQAQISGGGSPGLHRSYSFSNMMEIALAKALSDLGLSDLKQSVFPAASHFAHGSGDFVGNRAVRLPGLPYDPRVEPGFTMLCVAGDRSTTYLLTADDKGFYATVRHMLASRTGFTCLHVNPVFEMVTHNLGADYRNVLADAYPANPISSAEPA